MIVSNCTYTNNTSFGIGTNRYSGNAGAVSIGYDDTPRPDYLPNFIRITGSTFEKNRATALDTLQYDRVQVLSQTIYNQRGGGIAIYFGTANYSANIKIEGCSFEKNTARQAGGGLYMFLSGVDNAHSVSIQGCGLVGNQANFSGGGAQLSYNTSVSDGINVLITQTVVKDCFFNSNIANAGGGLSLVQINKRDNLNNFTIRNCDFVNNQAQLGSGLAFQYIFTVNFNSLEKLIVIEDW